MSKNLSELSGRKGLKDSLFDRLGKLAQPEGTPSPEAMNELAASFLVGQANVYGTASFYDFTKPENKGKKAYVCNGTACVCAGTQAAVQEELEKVFDSNEIGHMTCLGRCHENSAFHLNGNNYSGNEINHLSSLINGEASNTDNYLVQAYGKAILTEPFTSISSYYGSLKRVLESDRSIALNEIKESGLRGRGGAGFPMATKLEFCQREISETKFIICNADEGDPGAYSDRYLLENQPHSVLYGMLVAGYITGANWGVLYIRAEYPEAVEIIERELKKLYESNLAGDKILGTSFCFNFKVIRAQGSYICGEETALINSIEGQRPEVRVRPPYPAQQGLFNKPTVVNNVETIASLHFIMEQGGKAWKGIGTSSSSGTKLISLDGFFVNPGIYEVEMGTPLRIVIDKLGGGFKKPVKAMQIGGPLGGVVPLSKIDELTIDFESFAQHGFLLGHASIVCIPESMNLMQFIEHLFDFAAYESCGKCFPCRLGTKRGHELAQGALQGNKINRELLDDLLTTLQQGSLCAHGGGIPLPVKNIMHYFKDELNEYLN